MLQYKSLIQERHGLYFAWQVSEHKTPVFYTYSLQALADSLQWGDLKVGKISGIRLECSV